MSNSLQYRLVALLHNIESIWKDEFDEHCRRNGSVDGAESVGGQRADSDADTRLRTLPARIDHFDGSLPARLLTQRNTNEMK